MRRLGLLVLPILVLFFPSAANAAWQPCTICAASSVPNIRGDGASFDKFNTGLLFNRPNEYTYPAWSGGFSNSLDGGKTWGATTSYPIGAVQTKMARDGDGNRIWAYTLSNTIVVSRSSSTGGPAVATDANSFSVPGVDDMKLVVTPAGDTLIGWSNDSGDAGVVFWRVSSPSTNIPLTFNEGCDSTEAPTPYLDPDGYALFLWTCEVAGSKSVLQSHSTHAYDDFSFSNPSTLDDGSIVHGGQAPDGRGVLLTHRTEAIPANVHGETTTEVLAYASRRAGEEFETPDAFVGDADRRYWSASDQLPVAPNGRVLIGYSTATNMPNPTDSCFADPTLFTGSMAVGTIDPSTGDLELTKSAPTTPGTRWGFAPRVTAGPDGRLAVAYGYLDGCFIKPNYNEHIMLALDGEHFEDIGFPYGGTNIGVFTFTARGQLYVSGQHPAFPLASYAGLYDTDLPLTPATLPDQPPEPEPTPPTGETGSTGESGPTGATGSTDSTGSKSPPGEVSAKGDFEAKFTALQRIVSVSTPKRGGLSVTVATNSPGKFTLVVKFGRTVVARTSASVKPGPTDFQLKLNSKATKRLKKSGRLKASLISTFVPASGPAPAPVTRAVIFRK